MEACVLHMDIKIIYDKIYRYVYFRIGDADKAEDITQEAFLRYLRNTNNIDNKYEIRYLYTIARNLCIDDYRKAKPIYIDDIVTEMYYGDFSEKIISEVDIENMISKLDIRYREIIVLRYVNEESMDTISKILKCSRFAAYRKLRKAMLELKRLMEEIGYE